jgi:DNA-binding winged helix-turn-helix (wHTH) protein
MKANRYPLQHDATWRGSAATDAAVEFGRFSVLLRQRQLLADGLPVELGTRAFDLLLALLEADGSLVSKEALISRVWPGIVVSEENLKVQVSALRKALGEERDLVRTEFGRGYRFTAVLRSTAAAEADQRPTHPQLAPAPTLPRPASGGGLGWESLYCRYSPRWNFMFGLAAEGGRN